MSYSANYCKSHKILNSSEKEDNCIQNESIDLKGPFLDLFWKAYADERYYLMIHILHCKILNKEIRLRWFDRVPYHSAKELLAMVTQNMQSEYYIIVGWIFDHIRVILDRESIPKALEALNKVIEIFHIKQDQNVFENRDAFIFLIKLGFYDKSQASKIKEIIKQKHQIKYCIPDNTILEIVRVPVIEKMKRTDSKMEVEIDNIKKEVIFNLNTKFSIGGDFVSFDVCKYKDCCYFLIISGCRRDNNEILVYQHDSLINRFKNYHSRPFTILKCIENTRLLVTADMAYDISLWDYIEGNCIAVWKFHSRAVNDILCIENGMKIYSCSSDNSVRCFKIPQSVSSMTFPKSNKRQVVRHQKLVFSLNYPSSSAFCNESISSISLGIIKNEAIVFAGSVYTIRIYKEREMKLFSIIPLNDFKLT